MEQFDRRFHQAQIVMSSTYPHSKIVVELLHEMPLVLYLSFESHKDNQSMQVTILLSIRLMI